VRPAEIEQMCSDAHSITCSHLVGDQLQNRVLWSYLFILHIAAGT